MDRDDARIHVKEQLESYLEKKGLDLSKNFNCLNPSHSDEDPSMGFDRKRNKAHCFGCGADYDTFDLIGIDYGLSDPKDIFEKAYELFGICLDSQVCKIPSEMIRNSINLLKIEKDTTKLKVRLKSNARPLKNDFRNYLRIANSNVDQTDYFLKRGLSESTIQKFNLGYDPNFRISGGEQTWKAVIIPASDGGSYTVRNTDSNANKENRIRKVGASTPFNLEALKSGKPVFVVEGEIDALSIIEVGGEAVALGSTANANKLLSYLDKSDVPTLILALDNDEMGRMASEKLENELKGHNFSFLKADRLYRDYKDANEMLVADREQFEIIVRDVISMSSISNVEVDVNLVEEARVKYLNNSTSSHLQEFIDGIASSVDTPYIPTGFGNLDRVLDGGLYEGLYIIGAISSLGKTTYILQMVDQIAQRGQDVLFFSLEMARTELMAKSISRLTFELCKDTSNAKTARGITTGKRYIGYSQTEIELIEKSMKQYGVYADRIYIIEGMGEVGAKQVRKTVEEHIRFTGNKPIVVIDYLQLLAPHDPRATDKNNTDKAVMELKRISRDYKLPVLAISSFNRQNYNQPVSMEAFKESGAIEYSSDVLIGIQAKGAGLSNFDINVEKKKDPREIEIKILKNRNGATGDGVFCEYYPLFNYLREVGEI